MSTKSPKRLVVFALLLTSLGACDWFAKVRACPDPVKGQGTDGGGSTGGDTGSVTGGDTGSVTGGDTGSITGGDLGGGDVAYFRESNASGQGAMVIIRRGRKSPRRGMTDTIRLSQPRITLRID